MNKVEFLHLAENSYHCSQKIPGFQLGINKGTSLSCFSKSLYLIIQALIALLHNDVYINVGFHLFQAILYLLTTCPICKVMVDLSRKKLTFGIESSLMRAIISISPIQLAMSAKLSSLIYLRAYFALVTLLVISITLAELPDPS